MEKGEGLRRLRDTIDLLFMLEQLTDGLSGSEARSHELPWRGIKLTLAQSKQNILRAYEMLAESTQPARSPAQIQPPAATAARTGFSSLAGRIQRAPTSAGTVRELVPSPSNGELDSAGLEEADISSSVLGERG